MVSLMMESILRGGFQIPRSCKLQLEFPGHMHRGLIKISIMQNLESLWMSNGNSICLLTAQLQFDIIFVLNHADIDECIEETDNCDDNAICTNTDGSFTCLCDLGYSGIGAICTGELSDSFSFSYQLRSICFINTSNPL